MDFDDVKKPKHYVKASATVSTIGLIQPKYLVEAYPMFAGSAMKYALRAPHKGNTIQDYEKCIECLGIELERLENANCPICYPLGNECAPAIYGLHFQTIVELFRKKNEVCHALLDCEGGYSQESLRQAINVAGQLLTLAEKDAERAKQDEKITKKIKRTKKGEE